jgi:hypothetical protein
MMVIIGKAGFDFFLGLVDKAHGFVPVAAVIVGRPSQIHFSGLQALHGSMHFRMAVAARVYHAANHGSNQYPGTNTQHLLFHIFLLWQ